MKEVVIHAGTHKTATSYIQNRLWLNSERLQAQGVVYRYPRSRVAKHKPLAKALRRAQWGLWNRSLRRWGADGQRILLSAEQFTKPFCHRARFQPLLQLLTRRGYRLRVVLFLRDQPDYMNARYVHSLRRFYHCLPFDDYVRQQLRRGQATYDYNSMLSDMLACRNLTLDVLPFRSQAGDPFEQLMDLLGITSPEGWLPADPIRGNQQPGCRGVWLAQQVGRRLQAQGKMDGEGINSSQRLVRRIADARGWSADRFYGFSPELAREVAHHYASANDQLAQRLWGCSWRDRFPWHLPERRTYELPPVGDERQAMLAEVEAALEQLQAYWSQP